MSAKMMHRWALSAFLLCSWARLGHAHSPMLTSAAAMGQATVGDPILAGSLFAAIGGPAAPIGAAVFVGLGVYAAVNNPQQFVAAWEGAKFVFNGVASLFSGKPKVSQRDVAAENAARARREMFAREAERERQATQQMAEEDAAAAIRQQNYDAAVLREKPSLTAYNSRNGGTAEGPHARSDPYFKARQQLSDVVQEKFGEIGEVEAASADARGTAAKRPEAKHATIRDPQSLPRDVRDHYLTTPDDVGYERLAATDHLIRSATRSLSPAAPYYIEKLSHLAFAEMAAQDADIRLAAGDLTTSVGILNELDHVVDLIYYYSDLRDKVGHGSTFIAGVIHGAAGVPGRPIEGYERSWHYGTVVGGAIGIAADTAMQAYSVAATFGAVGLAGASGGVLAPLAAVVVGEVAVVMVASGAAQTVHMASVKEGLGGLTGGTITPSGSRANPVDARPFADRHPKLAEQRKADYKGFDVRHFDRKSHPEIENIKNSRGKSATEFIKASPHLCEAFLEAKRADGSYWLEFFREARSAGHGKGVEVFLRPMGHALLKKPPPGAQVASSSSQKFIPRHHRKEIALESHELHRARLVVAPGNDVPSPSLARKLPSLWESAACGDVASLAPIIKHHRAARYAGLQFPAVMITVEAMVRYLSLWRDGRLTQSEANSWAFMVTHRELGSWEPVTETDMRLPLPLSKDNLLSAPRILDIEVEEGHLHEIVDTADWCESMGDGGYPLLSISQIQEWIENLELYRRKYPCPYPKTLDPSWSAPPYSRLEFQRLLEGFLQGDACTLATFALHFIQFHRDDCFRGGYCLDKSSVKRLLSDFLAQKIDAQAVQVWATIARWGRPYGWFPWRDAKDLNPDYARRINFDMCQATNKTDPPHCLIQSLTFHRPLPQSKAYPAPITALGRLYGGSDEQENSARSD